MALTISVLWKDAKKAVGTKSPLSEGEKGSNEKRQFERHFWVEVRKVQIGPQGR